MSLRDHGRLQAGPTVIASSLPQMPRRGQGVVRLRRLTASQARERERERCFIATIKAHPGSANRFDDFLVFVEDNLIDLRARLKAHKQLSTLRAALEAHHNKNSHGVLARHAIAG